MDIISQIASQLGISREVATEGAGAVMRVIKEQAPAEDFDELVGAVPEASDWMSEASGAVGGGAGGLGALAGALGGSGGLAALVGAVANSGMDAGTAGKFVPMLLNLLQGQAGEAVFGKLASSVPLLQEAMGGGGASGVMGMVGKLFGR